MAKIDGFLDLEDALTGSDLQREDPFLPVSELLVTIPESTILLHHETALYRLVRNHRAEYHKLFRESLLEAGINYTGMLDD